MMRLTKLRFCLALAACSMWLVPGACAANDTARFNGRWKASFPYNGQTVVMVSVHENNGFKNYVIVPNGAMPAGSGKFSAINGKWTAAADKPNDSGTYNFVNKDSVLCTNAIGQSLLWHRDDAPLPPIVTPPPSAQEKIAKYEKEANAGDAPAALQLGLIYGTGLGVPVDYHQAMFWYRKSADEGNAAAMRNVAILYSEGDGVPQNMNLAIYWARKAAAAGNTQSQEWLRANGLSEQSPSPGASGVRR